MSATHHHQCFECKAIWEHPHQMAGRVDAHTCPRCGRACYVRHRLQSGDQVDYPWQPAVKPGPSPDNQQFPFMHVPSATENQCSNAK